MAESKGVQLAKTMQKHAGRAKEKFLQNLGKVDRTADDIFDEHLQNFQKQQNSATKLQKEFNNYIRCIRAVQAASKSLMDSLNEIYESQWSGHDLLYVQAQNLDMLWTDFAHKLGDQVLIPLNTYQNQFPEMRKKIDKRGRKLVDYDGQRHNYQSLQANPKKRDDLKVQRAKELMDEARRTYEQLNLELHDELPALYDSRVLFLVTNLQTLFAAEQVFHTESSKVFSELEAIVDKLANESQRASYSLKKHPPPQSPKSPNANSAMIINSQANQNNHTGVMENSLADDESPEPAQMNGNSTSNNSTSNIANDNTINNQQKTASAPLQTTTTAAATDDKSPLPTTKRVEELYDIPPGATMNDLPPGVLYRVKATYKYNREDVDELSFDVGEIIRVIEYDDPEEQEEGWLMGMKEGTNEKGMFPANFTKPL